MQDKEAFYIRLYEQLTKNMHFPSEYLFKFIITQNPEKEEQLREIFKETEVHIQKSNSSGNKYASFSVRIIADSPEQIIGFYRKAEQIDGIVSL